MSFELVSLNPSQTEFLFIGFPQQLLKLNYSIIHLLNDFTHSPVDYALNLGVVIDSKLVFSQRIQTVSKSRLYHIRDLYANTTIKCTSAGITATSVCNDISIRAQAE
jgi:hypothetical protein